MRHLCFLFICLLPSWVAAQATLAGTVTDALTGEPVAFATVYLDGTSKGEVTQDDGRFTLTGVALPASLVVSHLNYRNQTIALKATGAPLNIRLAPAEEMLAGVEVTDLNLRQETLAEFKSLLLGTDEWAQKAAILNDEVLRFDRDYRERTVEVNNDYMRNLLVSRDRPDGRWSLDRSQYFYEEAANLKAVSNGPLVIRLPHLGYTLRMDLTGFEAEYRSGRRAYLGTFFFAPDARIKARHRKNRERAFWGSAMHFARSLLANDLAGNGFKVVEVTKNPDNGHEVVKEINLPSFLLQTGTNVWELRGLAGRECVILYYADGKNRPLPPEKWSKSQPVQSRFFVEEDRCVLLAGGVFGDAAIAFSGYVGSLGLAWILPVDYVFGE